MKILHMGDAHLGKKQYNLSERLEDFRKSFTQCVDKAIQNLAKVLVIPGDIGDSPNMKHADVLHLQQEVTRAKAAGITVVGIEGNHDMADGNWLRICGITNLDEEDVVVEGTRFCGIRPMTTGYYPGVVERLARAGGQCDVFVTHQTFAEMANFDVKAAETFGMLTAEQLALVLPGVKYVAMGDIHDMCIHTVGDIKMAYPGSTDITSSSENPSKCVLLVDTDTWDIDVLDLVVRPHIELEVSSTTDLERLITAHGATPHGLFKITVDKSMEGGIKEVRKLCRENSILAVTQLVDMHKVELEGTGIDLSSWDRVQHGQDLSLAILSGDDQLDPEVQALLISIVKCRGENTPTILQEWYSKSEPNLLGAL